MNKELESWIDEVIDDLDGIDLDIDNIMNYRLAEDIVKYCGSEEWI